MNNVYHSIGWLWGDIQVHIETPLVPLIKCEINTKSEKYYVRIKLCSNSISATSNMYEFKMDLF